MQIMLLISVINNLLRYLDEKMMREVGIKMECDEIRFDLNEVSMENFDVIENHREIFSRIWKLQQRINECFGASFLIITTNVFLSQQFSFYFSIINNSNKLTLEFFSQPLFHITHITFLFGFLLKFCDKSDELVRNNFLTLFLYHFIQIIIVIT
jgi:hypothetical protein